MTSRSNPPTSSGGPQAVPPGTRLLHIGPHKTGSTAIQVALHEGRDALAAHGVKYAGRTVRPRRAGWALGVRGRPAGTVPPPMTYWDALVDDVASAPDLRVCISNEDFGRAEPDQIRRIVHDLGGPAVHVVAVARRLDQFLPSQWQERVKAGDVRAYEDWLRVVVDRLDEPADWDQRAPGFEWDRTNVLYAHDPLALARRWVDEVGSDRFTLVVSDSRDRRLIPDTFEQLLGLPVGTLVPNPNQSNRGLAWAEVEMIRAINARLMARGFERAELRDVVKRSLLPALKVREASAAGRSKPPLPVWAADAVREFADSRIDALRALGVRIIGDVEQLRVPPLAEEECEPPTLTADDAALAVEAALDSVGRFDSKPSA